MKSHQAFLRFCIMCFVCGISLAQRYQVQAPHSGVVYDYYVAATGNDSDNGLYPSYQGGSNGPFRTLNRAATTVKAGDTVQIRGGSYQEASNWITSGTEANPITITNYNDEAVIIDGNNWTIPSGTSGTLFRVWGDWNTASNLEIRYSSNYGIFVSGHHCTVDNIYVHHSWGAGIFITGWYGLVQNCRAYNNSLMNEYFRPHDGGWGTGISAARYPQYTTIRNCTAWDNWGEGISTFETYHITIEDCTSYNNQVNFYISDTKFCLFQRNLSYYTPGNMIQDYDTQCAILMGDEKFNPPSSDNTVINNLCLGGERNLFTGNAPNCLIANNTFVNAASNAGTTGYNVLFFAGTYINVRFENNIILQDDSTAIALNDGAGITFGYNNWSRSPARGCRGTEDVTGDPILAKTGPTDPRLLTPGWFRILESSPARDRAKVPIEVIEDFFKTPRGSAPDMGAFEFYNGTSSLTTSAAGSPTAGQAPLSVNFTGSASEGTSPYSYRWTFGDGTSSTTQNPPHTYSSAGSYTATLTVTDNASATASSTVNISVAASVPLSANAVATPISGQAPLSVNFTGSASGGTSPYSYRWTFGDGGTSTSQSPSHTYSSTGSYTATLTVTDNASATASSTVNISVTASVGVPLSADYVTSSTSGRGSLSVNFSGSGSGGTSPYSYRWTFGDGGSSTSQNPSHTYSSAGSYTATLTVSDSSSANARATVSITVRTVSNNEVKNSGKKIFPNKKLK